LIVCGQGCNRGPGPQLSFDHAYQTFLRGDLKQAQDEAEQGNRRFQRSSPGWALKFRTLEAETLLRRGMFQEVLTLLNNQATVPGDGNQTIEILAIEGAAYARLHSFSDADRVLDQAEQLCATAPDTICGYVIRAQGVLAMERGQLALARTFFEKSLSFARVKGDRFLEASALLNLSAYSLKDEHFDEAVDWADAAYQSSSAIGAGSMATKALGNLGWAYYNLGDSEKSLELSLQAEKRAVQVGDIIDQLSWLTNIGYVYAEGGDFSRAKQSYLQALNLARNINGKEDIYRALRALALVSFEGGELEPARTYSDEAIAIARADNNRLDELYPMLVKGLVAAGSHELPEAERTFREVQADRSANASLKWRAQHGLASLYENENRPDAADREYRTALTTFEAARTSLRRNDSKLPFSSNAFRIYDGYIHFLVTQQKPMEALRWADYSRARTLAEGLGLLPAGSSATPPLNAQEIARRVKGTVLFYWLGEKQSYLWAITPRKVGLFPLPAAAEIEGAVRGYRVALGGPQDVLDTANSDGRALYQMLIAPARSLVPKGGKVFVVPAEGLNNLNFETLLVSEPKLHYWIEDVTVANAGSLRLLASSTTEKERNSHTLLLLGNSLSPDKDYPELPKAAAEMETVAKRFSTAQRRVFQRGEATPEAYLASNPEEFSYIHFVAHGTASQLSPLDSAIVLSRSNAASDSFKLYARDIIQHPLTAELVTISACYGAGTRAYSGEGLVGLAWAFLRAGAHNVIAALWDASDVSTEQLMDKFYEELNRGVSPDAALRAAKLSLLRSGGAFRRPFYWAPFQLYVGS
jgi:CHAT domain-containing protein/tetratricopeptide (TPR) repeat protein